MAQREGSVYLYLFVVAMMLFVLVTVGFVMKSQELEKVVKGELKKAHGDVADGIAANKTLANELRAVKGLIVGVNLVDNYDDTDDMIENLKTNQLTSVLAAINQANKDLNRKPHPVFTNLLEPYALYPGTFKEYQGIRDAAVKERDKADKTFTAAIASRAGTIKTLTQDLQEQ